MSGFPSTLTALLADLIAVPSGPPDTGEAGAEPCEERMGERVAQHLRALGADVRLVSLAPGRPNVIGVFEPAGRAEATVVFAPHLDTVSAAGMTVPAFRLSARAGRLYGRGACDTKGPTAALLWALRAWTRSGAARRSRVRWIVAATAGEEAGSLGAHCLVERGQFWPRGSPCRSRGSMSGDGWAVDLAVALEPTDLRVVHAAKGILRLVLETRGRSAHGSHPELGVNAVYRMLPLALALRNRVAPALAANRHPPLGGASLNLGYIRGGQGINIVPDHCRIGLDIRVHPGCPAKAARRLVAAHARGAEITTEREAPGFVTGRDDPWVRRLRSIARGWKAVNWFCDANIFAAAGMPAVAFGPGRIAQAHTRDEYILRRELEAGAAAFLKFLERSPGGAS